jgi:hypothetical protein
MMPLMPLRLHRPSCLSNERLIVISPGDSGDSQIVATVMKPRDNFMRRPAQDGVTCTYSRYVSRSWSRFEYLICARVLIACLFFVSIHQAVVDSVGGPATVLNAGVWSPDAW